MGRARVQAGPTQWPTGPKAFAANVLVPGATETPKGSLIFIMTQSFWHHRGVLHNIEGMIFSLFLLCIHLNLVLYVTMLLFSNWLILSSFLILNELHRIQAINFSCRSVFWESGVNSRIPDTALISTFSDPLVLSSPN